MVRHTGGCLGAALAPGVRDLPQIRESRRLRGVRPPVLLVADAELHRQRDIGAPPKPLFEAAERLGIRWLSYDRPGYGESTRRPGRNVASAAVYAVAVAVDDISYVTPWGFDPTQTGAPVLFVRGRRDRIVPAAHAQWLARRLPLNELRLASGDGHIPVLNSAAPALEWLRRVAP